MAIPICLERAEYVEKTYFFPILCERPAANMVGQDGLARLPEEIPSST